MQFNPLNDKGILSFHEDFSFHSFYFGCVHDTIWNHERPDLFGQLHLVQFLDGDDILHLVLDCWLKKRLDEKFCQKGEIMKIPERIFLILLSILAALAGAIGGACAGWALGNKILALWPPDTLTFTYKDCAVIGVAALFLITIGMIAMLKIAARRKSRSSPGENTIPN